MITVTDIVKAIAPVKGAAAMYEALQEAVDVFNPDDSAAWVIDARTGQALFTPAAAELADAIVELAIAEDVDVYEIGLQIMRRLDRDQRRIDAAQAQERP